MARGLAIIALSLACGSSAPPRTVASSSASEVSATETPSSPTLRVGPGIEDPEPGFDDSGRSERRGGDLVVRSPPDLPTPNSHTEFRRHVEGELGVGSARIWVGPEVPDYVPLTDSSLELTLLDATSEGLLAYYRDPVGASSCGYDSLSSCKAVATLYSAEGAIMWRHALDDFLPRQRNLDIRDLSFGKGILFFNQVCLEPSAADSACNRIVALDTGAAKVAWRSESFSSTSRFLVLDDFIVSTYIGKKLPGAAVLIDRPSGKVLNKLELEHLPTRVDIGQEALIELRAVKGPPVRLKIVDGNRLAPAP